MKNRKIPGKPCLLLRRYMTDELKAFLDPFWGKISSEKLAAEATAELRFLLNKFIQQGIVPVGYFDVNEAQFYYPPECPTHLSMVLPSVYTDWMNQIYVSSEKEKKWI